MRALVRDLTWQFQDFLRTFGSLQLFLLRLITYTPRALLRPGLIIAQIYNAGARSLVIIMTCGFFIGMVLALQGVAMLERYGSEEAVGSVVALALLKELAPVVTALLFAGRAGTSLTSEIGLMKATDQLSGMEMMAVDPIRRVVLPRFLGGVIAMPFLVAIFSGIGLFGGYLVGVVLEGVDSGAFWSQMQTSVRPRDIAEGIIKSMIFGGACSLLAVFEGYNAVPTAEGVSLATTRAVVISAIVTLILDFMVTAVLL